LNVNDYVCYMTRREPRRRRGSASPRRRRSCSRFVM